jgi:hypothetical protein
MKYQLIMENWRNFITEAPDRPLDPKDITTMGELQTYFKSIEPGKLKKLVGKYGKGATKILGTIAGAVAGTALGPGGSVAGGMAAGVMAQEAVEALLVSAVLAFSNVEDGTYSEDSAISYFDLDDTVVNFLRDIESKGKDLNTVSAPEKESLNLMIKYIKMKSKNAQPSDTIASILDLTAQTVLDRKFKKFQKIKLSPLG